MRRHESPTHIVYLAFAAALGCGGPGGGADSRCVAPDDAVVGAAVTNYIKNLNPTPQRFLIGVGSDSALPAGAHRALQDKGPTWLFPPDSAMQATVRANLADKGDFSTLLVIYRGTQRLDEARTVVRLGGRYVGGEHDGKVAASRTIHFNCDSLGWTFSRTEEERST